MPFTTPLRRAAAPMLAITLAFALAACQATAPTPVPSDSPGPSATPAASVDEAALYAEIEGVVRDIRGLAEETPVDPELIDRAALSAYVRRTFNEDNPPEYLAAYERLLKHMGLVPEGDDLRALFIELLASQTAGLYNTEDETLYVVSRNGSIGPSERVTYAHEYTHALQDQAFDLDGLATDELDEGDRAIARTALAEGDATLVMSVWANGVLTADELAQLAVESNDPKQAAILERMPPILRETLLFPYTGGLNYVLGLQGSGGWHGVNAAYANPPLSTEQILHPERATEVPIDVAFPVDLATGIGNGWSEILQDTLGEFQLGIWLRDPGGLGAIAAGTVAEGWGGDRLVLLEGPDGAWAVVVDTAWDTPADADEFRTGALGIAQALQGRDSTADVLNRDDTSATVLIASSAEVLGRVANVLGLAG